MTGADRSLTQQQMSGAQGQKTLITNFSISITIYQVQTCKIKTNQLTVDLLTFCH